MGRFNPLWQRSCCGDVLVPKLRDNARIEACAVGAKGSMDSQTLRIESANLNVGLMKPPSSTCLFSVMPRSRMSPSGPLGRILYPTILSWVFRRYQSEVLLLEVTRGQEALRPELFFLSWSLGGSDA